VELPEGVGYTKLIGAGSSQKYLGLRSDGALVWIDPVKAAIGEEPWVEVVSPPPGTVFTDVTSAREAVLALDSVGGTWTHSAVKESERTFIGIGLAPRPKPGVKYLGVGAYMYDGLVLLSDGRVMMIRSGKASLEPQDPGVKYVRLVPGVEYPLALTADGEAVSLRWDWYLYEDRTRPRVVPDLTPGWRFVDAVTTEYGGAFAAKRFEGGSVKRFSTVHKRDLADSYANQCIAKSGEARKVLKVDVVTRGNPKGGTVVVKRLGKVMGKAKVRSWGGAVNIPVDVSGIKLDGNTELIKVKVVFQGTKTVKRSKPTTIELTVAKAPHNCSDW
jgi:hypothetical protein